MTQEKTKEFDDSTRKYYGKRFKSFRKKAHRCASPMDFHQGDAWVLLVKRWASVNNADEIIP